MNLLGAKLYDPAVAVSKATSSLLALTAFDTTNLRLTVTVPAHGMVRFRMRCMITGATTSPTVLLGVLNGATVVGRVAPTYENATANAATQNFVCDAEFTVTGLTPGSTSFDAAYAVQVIVASTNIKYGGPNTNGGANAWGGFVFEAWDPQPLQTNGQLVIDASGRVDVSKVAGTTQTAGDIPAKTNSLAFTVANQVDSNVIDWKSATAPAMTGDAFARLGSPAGASVSADVAAVKTDTAAVKTQTDKMAFTVANQIDSNVIDWKGATAPAMTGDAFARIGSAGVGLTNLGDTRIANLDAAISSRSTFAGGAVASVTGNVGGNVVGSVASVAAGVTVTTNNDKTGYGLSAASVQAIWDALTSALTTVGSIGKLLIDNINATISSRLATSGYTTPPTVTQVRTELDSNSTKLANLDTTVSSRLATGGYTAPDNADILLIKAKTDNLPASPAATSSIPTAAAIRGEMDANSTKLANLDAAVSTRLASGSYTAPDNTSIGAIKTQTDLIPAAPAAVGDIPTADENADALLKRDWTTVTGEASRSVLNALRFIRNKFSTTATVGEVTIYKEDDTTIAYTKTVTTDAAADPIVEG